MKEGQTEGTPKKKRQREESGRLEQRFSKISVHQVPEVDIEKKIRRGGQQRKTPEQKQGRQQQALVAPGGRAAASVPAVEIVPHLDVQRPPVRTVQQRVAEDEERDEQEQ
uniref:Uncharacterized protein n=1 Tax=Corethron hystrix TaxID=216773 RepID=A0A7S1C2G9_9STRA|mmetsp:Transcript_9637/g.21409  ORF Transcript_9637/g.21409 Transcript_9637/m.21409 type:complete len:110 (+) Transcript_9637:439-768(+)